MTQEVSTHAIAKRIRAIQERAAALGGDPIPEGTVEVGTEAVQEVLAVVDEQVATAPAGGGFNAAEARAANQAMSYLVDGGTYGWFYDEDGAAANTPINAGFTTGLTEANFVGAWVETELGSVNEITEQTEVTGTDEVTISVDTTGRLVYVVWLNS